MANAIRAAITAVQIVLFMALIVLLLPLYPLVVLFPERHRQFADWMEQRRLARSKKKWFVSGDGHGTRYRYYDGGDWVRVFPDMVWRPCPDDTVGRYVWQLSNVPLAEGEIRLLEDRMLGWFHRENTKFLRFEPPVPRASKKERDEMKRLNEMKRLKRERR